MNPSGPLPAAARVVVLIPIFNDWVAAAAVLARLDAAISGSGHDVEVLLVDDGSLVPHGQAFQGLDLKGLKALSVLQLRRNLGHQRAIAVGLAYVQENLQPRAVVVMDGDGEDDPADVPRLLEHAQSTGKLVFAARARRSEGLVFQLGYRVYQLLHWLLTGYRVRVGNFSAIPAATLQRLVVVSELWNHYAAAVFNARIEYATLPATRRPRLAGRSHMNFTALVVHGLSALSVYSQIIGVRLMIAAVVLCLVLSGGLAAAAIWQMSAPSDRTYWPLMVVLVLLVLLLQALSAGIVFVLLVLAGRQAASFIPLRDYHWFVDRCVSVWNKAPS